MPVTIKRSSPDWYMVLRMPHTNNYPIASRIISDTIKAGLVKDYDTESKSKKYAKYVPYWF